MENLSKNFKASEFTCNPKLCGCGFCSPSAKLILSLQEIRDKAGVAVTIESGCRCTLRNKNVGGVPGLAANIKKGNPGDVTASAHTRGEAADIRISGYTKQRAYDFIVALHRAGELPWLRYVEGIKGSANNVHIGVDDFTKRSTPYGGIK